MAARNYHSFFRALAPVQAEGRSSITNWYEETFALSGFVGWHLVYLVLRISDWLSTPASLCWHEMLTLEKVNYLLDVAVEVFPTLKTAVQSWNHRWPVGVPETLTFKVQFVAIIGIWETPVTRIWNPHLRHTEPSSGSALRNQADPELETLHYILNKVANVDRRIESFCFLKNP